MQLIELTQTKPLAELLLAIRLPMPPSGHDDIKDYKQVVAQHIRDYKRKFEVPTNRRLAIAAQFWFSTPILLESSDLDNRLKHLFDALADAGGFNDNRFFAIRGVTKELDPDGDFRVDVKIWLLPEHN